MSNKLKKKIKCCLCDETKPFTEDCQKLYEQDVCPDCAVKVTAMVNQVIDDMAENITNGKTITGGERSKNEPEGYPAHVKLEPEGYYDAEGKLKLTGFGLVDVRKEEG